MIHLETGLTPMYSKTLGIHFKYMNKVFSSDDGRFPKILAQKCKERNLGFFEVWTELAETYMEPLNTDNTSNWQQWQDKIIQKINQWSREDFQAQASGSLTRNSYKELEYNLNEKNYFHDRHSIEVIRNIFLIRGEVLKLNYRPHILTESSVCSMCNMNETENVEHFLSVCPILKEIRIIYFGKLYLDHEETLEYLNGKNWTSLANFVKEALIYRQKVINEDF